jgi:hypothetical protein
MYTEKVVLIFHIVCALGFTQSITAAFPLWGGEGVQLVHKANSLTAIFEPIV